MHIGGGHSLFIYLCVWKRGGMLIFSPWWGGHAFLSSRNRGGQHFFPYSEALSATSPSAEIYEQSLSIKRQYGIADNSSNKVCKPCIQTIKRMNHAVSWQSAGPNVCMTEPTVWLSSRPYSLQPMILVQHWLHSSTCFSLLTVSIPLLITLVPSRSSC